MSRLLGEAYVQLKAQPALKLGRLPGHVPNGLRDLTWYVAGALPAPPTSVAVPVLEWGMDGNDVYGDCGVAGFHHADMALDVAIRRGQPQVPANGVVDYYLKYTGGQDTGVVLADFLAYVKANKFYTRTLRAYAPVSVTDYSTLQFTVNAYGAAYTGIQVTDLMMNAVRNGQTTWTADMFANGTVEGGHCVPIVGYDSQKLYVVTWGAIQGIEYSAWHLMAEEAWALIFGEIRTEGVHGINFAALEADLAKLSV